MTLPPVVSDAERCAARGNFGDPYLPHDWDEPTALLVKAPTALAEVWPVCRFCGGRKPDG